MTDDKPADVEAKEPAKRGRPAAAPKSTPKDSETQSKAGASDEVATVGYDSEPDKYRGTPPGKVLKEGEDIVVAVEEVWGEIVAAEDVWQEFPLFGTKRVGYSLVASKGSFVPEELRAKKK